MISSISFLSCYLSQINSFPLFRISMIFKVTINRLLCGMFYTISSETFRKWEILGWKLLILDYSAQSVDRLEANNRQTCLKNQFAFERGICHLLDSWIILWNNLYTYESATSITHGALILSVRRITYKHK